MLLLRNIMLKGLEKINGTLLDVREGVVHKPRGQLRGRGLAK